MRILYTCSFHLPLNHLWYHPVCTFSDLPVFKSFVCRHWTGNAYRFLFLPGWSWWINNFLQQYVTPFTNSSAAFFAPSSLPGRYFRSKLESFNYLAVQIAPHEDFYPWHWDVQFLEYSMQVKTTLSVYLPDFCLVSLVDSLKGYMWCSVNYYYINIKIWTYFWLYNLSLLPVPYVAFPNHLPDELKLK